MLKIYKLNETVNIPKHATAGSACFDLEANLIPGETVISYKFQHSEPSKTKIGDDQAIVINVFERMLIPTNMILDIPKNYQVKVHPRSGLSLKNGIVLGNMEGVIDSDYVDPLYVMLWNISGYSQVIKNGMRIAQAELVPVEQYKIVETFYKPSQKTDRIGGVGSTGI